MSSSSRSLAAFLACFKGLTLPPVTSRFSCQRNESVEVGEGLRQYFSAETDLLGWHHPFCLS
jgi:hypothetical protein